MRHIGRTIIWITAWLIAFVCAAWAFGALYYDFPVGKSIVPWTFVVALLAALILIRGAKKKIAVIFTGFALVLAWWITLKPSHEGQWQADVAQLAKAEIKGDEITFHNVRHCDYRTETDYTPHWQTRTVRLSQLSGIDIAIDYWGSPWIAHPIVSFQFADAPPLCFSIETRKTVGQNYSAIGGLYRQYALIYLVSDERDVVRLRTNFRHENIYLYRMTLPIETVRKMFLAYIRSLNEISSRPRWYNAITTNCTTSIRAQNSSSDRIPWDWRILVNGKLDEMMYEHQLISTGGLPFAELKQLSSIDLRAQAANQDPEFSARIRDGLPEREASFR